MTSRVILHIHSFFTLLPSSLRAARLPARLAVRVHEPVCVPACFFGVTAAHLLSEEPVGAADRTSKPGKGRDQG